MIGREVSYLSKRCGGQRNGVSSRLGMFALTVGATRK